MRPDMGSKAQPSPPRKASVSPTDEITPLVGPSHAPTSFFMATEGDIDNRAKLRNSGPSIADSSYGVRSFDDSTSATDGGDEEEEQDKVNPRDNNRRRSTIRPQAIEPREESTDSAKRQSSISSTGSSPQRPSIAKSGIQLDGISQPLTPISFASPALGSEAPSSPKSLDGRSLRISDDDELGDTASQAILSSAEEDNDLDDGELPGTQSTEGMQLVMPSIMMPTRRPFTDKGKQVGKLKVLLAGPSGAGKTSLIKSFVQICEDIVHVDSIPSTKQRRSSSKSKTRPQVSHANPTRKVSEIYASTKPYPQWWQEHEEGGSVTRRRDVGESMLERNICFVDTPGYNNGTSVLEGMKTTLDYIEGQMAKSTMIGELKESELLSMLSGNGGLQVDLILYLISHDLKPADIEYLRQLTHLTPTLPILAKSDTILQSSLSDLKPAILSQLRTANITPFPLPSTSPTPLPYATCSSPSSDLDSMDASLLMQPDFLPPLTPSDLPTLISSILDPPTIALLKHASARKLLRWRSTPRASPLPAPLTAALSPSLTPSLTPSTSSPPALPSTSLTTRQQAFSPLTHPRLAAHTQREERLANIRLANWAGQLQRSLAGERARYEELARRERGAWLMERLEECRGVEVGVGELEGGGAAGGATGNASDAYGSTGINVNAGGADNALVAVQDGARAERSGSGSGSHSANKKFSRPGMVRVEKGFDAADPLGLIRVMDGLHGAGWTAVRILGGCGVVGGIAVLVARMSGEQGEWGQWGGVLREWWERVWWGGE